MSTISIVAPVIIMIVIGYICKLTGFISEEGILNIKKYITGIAIPVLVFHAVGVADYSSRTLVIFGIMMAAILIAFAVGNLAKPLVSEKFRNYFPFLITEYEGGMLCYPLYQNLCGDEHFSNIVIIDLAACVFVFGVYLGLLQLVDRGVPFSFKKLCLNAVKTPSFIALVLGLIMGISGLMDKFLASDVAVLYTSIKEIIVTPITPMILICVGYSLTLKKEIMPDVLKTAGLRLVLQTILMLAVLWVMQHYNMDKYMLAAFLIYFFSTPNFNTGTVVQNKEGNQFISTTTSLYCIISIISYIVVASLIF
jgi:hypothetical protein